MAGQGQVLKTKSQPKVDILERGEIFFFYRPKVDKEEAHSPDDVQRLYIVLRPESGERPVEEKQDPHSGKEGAKMVSKKAAGSTSGKESASEGGHGGSTAVNIEKQPLLRLLIKGQKRLPDPSKKRQPYWGFVEFVSTRIEDVQAALQGDEYETKTRGSRRIPPARALGEGVYCIVRHYPTKKAHTHLVYKLEFPPEDEKNEPREALNIKLEGSFIIQIKNPDQHGNSQSIGIQNKRKAALPAHLQERFRHRRWHPADPPDFLNYEGCEFLLNSASDDIEDELGLELKTEGEHESSCSDLLRTFGEDVSTRPLLRTFGEDVSTRPLLRGTWA